MNRIPLSILLMILVIVSGCQDTINGDETPSDRVEPPTQVTTESGATTATDPDPDLSTPSNTPVDETRKAHLEEFARVQEQALNDNTNYTNVDVRRQHATANLIVSFELPETTLDRQEDKLETTLEALVQSQYNWVVEGAESYLADNITVQTDFGEGTASKELLQLYIDDKLDRATVAYIWAGEFDPYTELGKVENSSHTTRTERLAYTAEVMKQNMEADKQYVTDVETASGDETIYVKVRQTEDAPNPTWPIEDVAVAYRETVTELGPQYMPSNGVRGYTYSPDNSPGFSFVVRNPWVVSEYVGLFPLGESSLNALNSMEEMDDPHDGPP